MLKLNAVGFGNIVFHQPQEMKCYFLGLKVCLYEQFFLISNLKIEFFIYKINVNQFPKKLLERADGKRSIFSVFSFFVIVIKIGHCAVSPIHICFCLFKLLHFLLILPPFCFPLARLITS